jgi:hypothetical protein
MSELGIGFVQDGSIFYILSRKCLAAPPGNLEVDAEEAPHILMYLLLSIMLMQLAT